MQACWRAFALATSVVVAGCSSSSSSSNGPDCTMFTACGGNVVGTWKLTKACISGLPNPLAAFCPSSTFQVSESLSGTVKFVANDGVTLAMGVAGGTYSSNISSSVVEDLNIPASCLQGATCAQVQSSINQSVDGGAPAAMGTCTDAAGGCACHVTAAGSATPTTGVYSVSGSTITLDGQPSPYCVKGSGLLIQNPTTMMAGAGTFTIAATKE
jgi:hypothetical protein